MTVLAKIAAASYLRIRMAIFRRIVAGYEILVAAWALLYAQLADFGGPLHIVESPLLWAAVVAMVFLSIAAGVQLWRDRPSGYWLTIAAQMVQMPVLATTWLAYEVSLGPEVSYSWRADSPFHVNATWGTVILASPTSYVAQMGLNLVPLLVIIALQIIRAPADDP